MTEGSHTKMSCLHLSLAVCSDLPPAAVQVSLKWSVLPQTLVWLHPKYQELVAGLRAAEALVRMEEGTLVVLPRPLMMRRP